MTTTCLVSNYNYAHFIGEALDSALAQTVPFDQIVVVDDGSTDGSVELLARKYARYSSIHVISKENQGQLSCFNDGFARASGDIVFFLDADDLYEPNYVERTLAIYGRDPHCDFVFCGHRLFGRQDSVQLEFSEDRDLGYSVILAANMRDWIGAPTSCLSMRRRVLKKILPLPFPDDWRTRADDCLVFGASLVGARKYYVAEPLVRYRVHDENHFFGRSVDRLAVYRRRLAINSLFEFLQRKLCYDVPRLSEFHHREFCTIAKPTFRQLVTYCRIGIASRSSLLRRLSCMAVMTGHFLRSPARQGTDSVSAATSSVDDNATRPLRVFAPETPASDDAASDLPALADERRNAA